MPVTEILRSQQKSEGAFNCNTVGYLNPVWYKFRLYSDPFTGVTDLGGGNIRIDVVGSAGVVGDKITLSSADNFYEGTYVGTITANGVNTSDVSGIPYNGNTAGFTKNLTQHRNLHIETRLIGWFDTIVKSKATSSWFTSPNLLGIIDLQSELLSLAYKREGVDYTLVVYQGLSSFQYRLQHQFVFWNVFGVRVEGGWATVAEFALGTPSRKQIKELYGNNLLDYVIRSSGEQFVNFEFDASLVPWLQQGGVGLQTDWTFLNPSQALANLFTDETKKLYQKLGMVNGSMFEFSVQVINPITQSTQFADSGMSSPTSWGSYPVGGLGWTWVNPQGWNTPMSNGSPNSDFLNTGLGATPPTSVNIRPNHKINIQFQFHNHVGPVWPNSYIHIYDAGSNLICTTPFVATISSIQFVQVTIPSQMNNYFNIQFSVFNAANPAFTVELRVFSVTVVEAEPKPIDVMLVGSNDGIVWDTRASFSLSNQSAVLQAVNNAAVYAYSGIFAKVQAGPLPDNDYNQVRLLYFKKATNENSGNWLTRFKAPMLWMEPQEQAPNPTMLSGAGWHTEPTLGTPWFWQPSFQWTSAINEVTTDTDFLVSDVVLHIPKDRRIIFTIQFVNVVGPAPANLFFEMSGINSFFPAWNNLVQTFEFATNIGPYNGPIKIRVVSDGGAPFSANVLFRSVVIMGKSVPRPMSYVVDANSGIANFHIIRSWLDVNRNPILSEFSNVGVPEAAIFHFINNNAPAGAKYMVTYGSVGPPTHDTVINAITLSVREFCAPSVLVEWENSLGGVEQWVFQRRQAVSFELGQAKTPYEFYEPDIENSNGNLGKNGTDTFFELELVDEFVPTNDIPWLHEMKTSKQVRCIFPNGAAVFCVVIDSSTPARTRAPFTEFRVRVRMPRNFSPSLVDDKLFVGPMDIYAKIGEQ